ncbi:sugar kinase [Aureimonas sp. SA4125]|uniref:carbohydrate kinase family protein n=1 Tax=Aureimonas sp. SA4125 TaxID=2826993 RepID=UPI001CC4613B|nr:carbohydrate kinase family protein [Aureimonas sp. SA4125]BDA86565.1 sugar kinase [Aureimonas sp. SA4125]
MTDIDVLCIGDLDVDMFVSVSEIPGFDQKVAGRNHGQKAGGMSANCAVAVSRLGLKSRLVAAVGSDPAGDVAIVSLTKDAVDLQYLARRHDEQTFMCLVLLSPAGEKSLIKLETPAYLPSVSDLVPDAFDGVRHLHVTFGSPELSLAALRMASERGLSTSLDLEPPDIVRNPHLLSAVLPLIDTLFLNKEAFEAARNVLGEPLTPLHLRGDAEVIVTLGAGGCQRFSGKHVVESPGFVVDPVDTTGAGDCFAGAYLVSRISGMPIGDGLRFANAAAALSTRSIGAQEGMPRRRQVEDFLASRLSTGGRPDLLKTEGAVHV